jgi:nucleoside 2-deoxyribosyltransferase
MRIYVAGALFSEAERAWLDGLAARLREEGFDCFVPHEQFSELNELTPAEVFRVDAQGVRDANVLLAWLDGPSIDDGTACEIGMFAELAASGDPRYHGIVGLVTDLRLQRRRGNAVGDGMNLFVAGAIQANGRICWSVDEAIEALCELLDDWFLRGRRRSVCVRVCRAISSLSEIRGGLPKPPSGRQEIIEQHVKAGQQGVGGRRTQSASFGRR